MPKEKIILRLATRKDRIELHNINNSCLPVVYSVEEWEEHIAMKQTYIVVAGGIPVAYCACDNNGCIMTFAVQEKYRQRGLGKKLLLYSIQNMKAAGVKTVHLRVKVSNGVAQKLYESVGFVSTHILDKYYSGIEDAHYMELKL